MGSVGLGRESSLDYAGRGFGVGVEWVMRVS